MKMPLHLYRSARRAQLDRSARRTSHYVLEPVRALETRQLMAAGPLGINVAPTLNYVDLMKEARPWAPLGATTLATDTNGWPLADAQIVVFDQRVNQPYNGPDPNAVQPDVGGAYHLSFQGQATIQPDYFQYFAVQNQVYNAATNTTTADLFFYHNLPPILEIDFRNTVNLASSTKAGIANVKLIQPGYDANTTQVFTSDMVNAVAPFTTLRYLNVDGANSYSGLFDTTYQTNATASFPVTAGSHVITFKGLGSAAGDTTAFLDSVNLFSDGSGAVTPPSIGDPGFEAVQIGAGNYRYNPSGSAWTFGTSSGLTSNNSAFTSVNPNAPEGQQVAFLQGQGTISQTVTNFAAGNYHLSFATMLRNGNVAQTIQVLVDGNLVGTFKPPVGKLVTLDWSQRKLPTASSQTSGPGAPGQAWEYMIALANTTNTDMWINIPGPATSDYVTQLANLIKNGDMVGGVFYLGLKSNLKVNFEVSNEVWGGIYNNFIYNIEAAQIALSNGDTALTNDGNTGLYDLAQRYQLQQTMNDAKVFRSVFGPDPTFAKIRPIVGSGEGDYSYFARYLPWFETTYGSPSQYLYGIGAANYSNPTDYTSVDHLISSLYASLPQSYTTGSRFTTIANYYGLHNIAYEGGTSTAGGSSANDNQVSLNASRDPRLEDFTRQLYANWYASGGDIAAVFDGPYDMVTPQNQFATAELAQAANPSASAKYRGLVDLSQASPQAVTAGVGVSPLVVTSLPLAGDSLGQSFASPTKGQTAYYLLNVAAAGQYTLTLQTGTSPSNGQVAVSLGDTNPLGTTTVGSAGIYKLATLTLHAGLNTVSLATLSPFNVASLTLTLAPPALTDSGFEDNPQFSGSRYLYNPGGTAWTFAGQSGLTGNNTGFTNGNPNAPEGQQVAFLQNQGTISQTFTNPTAANFQLNFQAAQRGGYGSVQSFQMLVDGKVVGTFVPGKTSYQSFTTTSFPLSVGTHTVVFQGLASGDATDFLDAVNFVQAFPTSTFADAGFEDFPQGGGYLYNPAGTAWTFAGQSGLTGNNTGFTNGNPNAPEGQQVAFLQNQGAISQSFTVAAAGNYQISLLAAQRGGYGSVQSFQVLVDGTGVGTFTPGSTSYLSQTTSVFPLSVGTHTFVFQGLNASGDATDFLDAVNLVPVAAAPSSVVGTPSAAAALVPAVPGSAASAALTVAIPGSTTADPANATPSGAVPLDSPTGGPVVKIRRRVPGV